ncbi:MAG: hypothetical protein JWQ18_1354 [Conexibacter sp.]|nr:hypothetical protein [Conexibacter sp.]
MRIRRPLDALSAVPLVVVGTLEVTPGKDTGLGVLWLLAGARWAWSSTRERPSVPEGALGPGPLAPSGTGRFRATGWPPSKDPADYR